MASSGQLLLKSDGKIALDPTTGKVQLFDTGVCACCDSIDCNGCPTPAGMTMIVSNVQTDPGAGAGWFVWTDIAWNGTYALTYGTYASWGAVNYTGWYRYMGTMGVTGGATLYDVWYVAQCALNGFGQQVMCVGWAYRVHGVVGVMLFSQFDGPGGALGLCDPPYGYSVVRTCGGGSVLFPNRGTTGVYQCPPSLGAMSCGDVELVIP